MLAFSNLNCCNLANYPNSIPGLRKEGEVGRGEEEGRDKGRTGEEAEELLHLFRRGQEGTFSYPSPTQHLIL